MKKKNVFKALSLVFGAMACSGCVSGLPAPSGDVWSWVSATTTHGNPYSDTAALESHINTEFSSQLPMTVRQFEEMLESERFECGWASPWNSRQGATNTRDCIYFQRGPTSENACLSGERVAISISYSYTNADHISMVTTFNTRVIMGLDGDAHGSGICFPL